MTKAHPPRAALAFWRRMDTPGHDACRLEASDAGWTLEGTAVFGLKGSSARLNYRVECDAAWRTARGHVQGWLGAKPIELRVVRVPSGAWVLDGTLVPGLDHCVDLDLGFTPATNTIAIRRLALTQGQTVDAPAAWLDVEGPSLELLPQRYERRGAATYWYESPSASYTALLELDRSGLIRRYPELWESES